MSNAITYKCPNCGGDLKYNPEKSLFSCEFCRSDFTKEKIDELYKTDNKDESSPKDEPEYSEKSTEQSESSFEENAVSFFCPNCGAKIITTDTTAASECYYCHNPVVLEGRLSGEFKPDMVIPFKLAKKDAQQKFADWCRSKKFLKKEFKSQSEIEKIQGIYLPFWLVDAEVDGELNGIAKNVRSWRSGEMIYTETKTYRIERQGVARFKNIPRFALNTINSGAINEVWPFDLSKTEDFSMAYLSGFAAEKFELDSEKLTPELHGDAKRYTSQLLRNTVIGHTSFVPSSSSQSVSKDKWSYVLLPVWLMYTSCGEKKYCFAVNGQTGEVGGTLPVDFKKLSMLFAGISAVVYLLLNLLGGLIG